MESLPSPERPGSGDEGHAVRTEFQAWNSSSGKGLDRKLRLGS